MSDAGGSLGSGCRCRRRSSRFLLCSMERPSGGMPEGLSFATSFLMTKQGGDMAEHTPIHNRGPEEEKREAAVHESAEDQARRPRVDPADQEDPIPQQGTNKSKGIRDEALS